MTAAFQCAAQQQTSLGSLGMGASSFHSSPSLCKVQQYNPCFVQFSFPWQKSICCFWFLLWFPGFSDLPTFSAAAAAQLTQTNNQQSFSLCALRPRAVLRLEAMVGLITSPLILSSLQAGFGNESLQSYMDLGSNSWEFHETSIALNSFFTPKSSRGSIGNL